MASPQVSPQLVQGMNNLTLQSPQQQWQMVSQPQWQMVSQVPAVSQPQAQQQPGFPNLGGTPGMPGMPGMPSQPQVQQPQAAQPSPYATLPPGFPNFGGMPGMPPYGPPATNNEVQRIRVGTTSDDRSLGALIVTVTEGSSYDPIFQQVEQTDDQGEVGWFLFMNDTAPTTCYFLRCFWRQVLLQLFRVPTSFFFWVQLSVCRCYFKLHCKVMYWRSYKLETLADFHFVFFERLT